MNTQFKFHDEWFHAARALNDATLEAELIQAIIIYGIHGSYAPSSSAAVNALMTLIIPQIDAANKPRKPRTSPSSSGSSRSASRSAATPATMEEIYNERISCKNDNVKTLGVYLADHATGSPIDPKMDIKQYQFLLRDKLLEYYDRRYGEVPRRLGNWLFFNIAIFVTACKNYNLRIPNTGQILPLFNIWDKTPDLSNEIVAQNIFNLFNRAIKHAKKLGQPADNH